MEQSFRRLKEELLKNPLVKKVKCDYYCFKVTWKSGIKERLVLNKYDNNRLRIRYLKSIIYRPHFLPKALWWEHLSNGYKPKPHFLEDVEYEDETEQYSNLINWKWSDYESCQFYERLILIHEILQYIIDHGWKEQKYPENALRKSLQIAYNEPTKTFYYRDGFTLKSYRKYAERPAGKLLEHFMPYGFYGVEDPQYFMNGEKFRNRKRIYLAIRNVINNNEILKKKGYKILWDFNYKSILTHMRNQYKKTKIKPYKIRQIGLYRAIIERFGLQGKSFYDVDPMMGEMHIAAHISECPYYYREAAPFDQGAQELSKFINSECEQDNDKRYDFGIYDGNSIVNYDVSSYAFKIMESKVDLIIIYINDTIIDRWLKEHPNPIESVVMKIGLKYGRWLLYYS